MVDYLFFFFLIVKFIFKIDLSKPNLFVLFDDDIILYNIWNNTGHYSSRLLNRINIEKNNQFNRIQYDPNQMFVIYYDRSRNAILWFVILKSTIDYFN